MFASPAHAQAAGAGTGAAQASGGFAALALQFAPLVLIFVIFYLLMIRPQQKKIADQRAQISAVKKGDTVVTGGGKIGRVTKVGDDEVEVELAPNVRVRVVKATLAEVRPTGAKPAND